jgi:hypothetical protein
VVEFFDSIWTNSVIKPNEEREEYEEWEILHTRTEIGATFKLIRCYFDKRVYLLSPRDIEVERCVFAEGVHGYTGIWMGGVWKSFRHNFVRWLNEGTEWSYDFGNTVEDSIFIKDLPGWNPHFISVRNGTGEVLIRNNIIWFTGTGTTPTNAEGDTWMLGSPASGTREENTVLMEGNIYLPNGQGPDGTNNISGTGFTILTPPDNPKQVVFRRNTVYAGAGVGGCNVGETNVTGAGEVAALVSNCFVGTDRGGGVLAGKKLNNLGHAETDVVLAENADYNAGYRLEEGSNYGNGSGKGYNDLSFSGSSIIGAHDLDDTDPDFVDPSRTPATWDASLGGAGTVAGAMARLVPLGDRPIESLLSYIRAGFRPQNPALCGAGDPSDGSPDIGAVDCDYSPQDLIFADDFETADTSRWNS